MLFFSISPTTPITPPILSSTPYPSPTLSNISMVPPVGGRVSPSVSPVSTRAQHQVDVGKMTEEEKEVVVGTVQTECVQQDGDKDLKVKSGDCLNDM